MVPKSQRRLTCLSSCRAGRVACPPAYKGTWERCRLLRNACAAGLASSGGGTNPRLRDSRSRPRSWRCSGGRQPCHWPRHTQRAASIHPCSPCHHALASNRGPSTCSPTNMFGPSCHARWTSAHDDVLEVHSLGNPHSHTGMAGRSGAEAPQAMMIAKGPFSHVPDTGSRCSC